MRNHLYQLYLLLSAVIYCILSLVSLITYSGMPKIIFSTLFINLGAMNCIIGVEELSDKNNIVIDNWRINKILYLFLNIALVVAFIWFYKLYKF